MMDALARCVCFVRAGALPGASASSACVLAFRLACTHAGRSSGREGQGWCAGGWLTASLCTITVDAPGGSPGMAHW